MRRAIAISLLLAIAGASVNAFAQQPPADPFLDEVNAELDRRAGEEVPEQQSVETPPTAQPFYYLRVFSALCLVLGLIIAAGYAARRFGGKTPLLAGADLGQVLGRLHLSRNATLYFIEAGGRVLLIGVTGQSVTTLAQFDAQQFERESDEPVATSAESFLAQLQASTAAMRPSTPARDDDVLSLKRDIQRLQDYLREESRETSD